MKRRTEGFLMYLKMDGKPWLFTSPVRTIPANASIPQTTIFAMQIATSLVPSVLGPPMSSGTSAQVPKGTSAILIRPCLDRGVL
jgi:hypothetical protein